MDAMNDEAGKTTEWLLLLELEAAAADRNRIWRTPEGAERLRIISGQLRAGVFPRLAEYNFIPQDAEPLKEWLWELSGYYVHRRVPSTFPLLPQLRRVLPAIELEFITL